MGGYEVGDSVVLGAGHPRSARGGTVVGVWARNDVRAELYLVRLDEEPDRVVLALPSEMGPKL